MLLLLSFTYDEQTYAISRLAFACLAVGLQNSNCEYPDYTMSCTFRQCDDSDNAMKIKSGERYLDLYITAGLLWVQY